MKEKGKKVQRRSGILGLLPLVLLLMASFPVMAQTNVKQGLKAPASCNFNAVGGASSPLYISGESNTEFRISKTGSNNEWCTAARSGTSPDIIIKATKNTAPLSREATVFVEVISQGKRIDTASIRVIQEGTAFSLDKNELKFNAQGTNTESVNMTAEGDWSLVKDETSSRAKWIKIGSESGKGNKRIAVSVEKNNTIFDRKAEVFFRDDNNNEILLTVLQVKSSTMPVESYDPLGSGYDICGPYVTEIKKELLDVNKLIDDDYIQIQTINSGLKTIKETATSFQSMVTKMSNTTEVNADGKAGLYSGSVKVAVGYKKGDSISSKQEFATISEQYRKADVQINSLSAADLKRYLKPDAAAALNSKKIDAQRIIDDYGTHVIVGFILGGSYNYWMSANTYNTASNTSFLNVAEVAVAYKKDSTKAVNASVKNIYESYKSNASSDFNFHEYLDARGGESQYVSLLKPNFDMWQKSLEKKWSIIDFYGKGIIPLWEFVSDATQKKELKTKIENYIKERGAVTEYIPKTLTIRAVKAHLNTTAGFLEGKKGILLHLSTGGKYILKYDRNLNFNSDNQVLFQDKKIDIDYKSTENKTITLDGYGETASMHNKSSGELVLSYNKDTKKWTVNGQEHGGLMFKESIDIRFGDGKLKYRVDLEFTVR